MDVATGQGDASNSKMSARWEANRREAMGGERQRIRIDGLRLLRWKKRPVSPRTEGRLKMTSKPWPGNFSGRAPNGGVGKGSSSAINFITLDCFILFGRLEERYKQTIYIVIDSRSAGGDSL